jgi:hypothetical protein
MIEAIAFTIHCQRPFLKQIDSHGIKACRLSSLP